MKYSKPEILAVAPALDSVQSSKKPAPAQADSNSRETATAYEADE
jgi:hypothetical protein